MLLSKGFKILVAQMRLSFTLTSTTVVALACAMFLLPLACAAETPGPAFKPGALLSQGNNEYLFIVSTDKKAGIVISEVLEEQLGGIGSPSLATRVFSISLPLEGAEKGVKLEVFLEGAVFRLKGTDISLISTVNGEAHVMDFANFLDKKEELRSDECKKFEPVQALEAVRRKVAAKNIAPPPKKPEMPGKPGQGAQLEPETDSSFVQCILFEAPSASDLRVNVVLAMHRHNRDSAGYVNVTTIGANIQSKDKAAK